MLFSNVKAYFSRAEKDIVQNQREGRKTFGGSRGVAAAALAALSLVALPLIAPGKASGATVWSNRGVCVDLFGGGPLLYGCYGPRFLLHYHRAWYFPPEIVPPVVMSAPSEQEEQPLLPRSYERRQLYRRGFDY